jgi:hypothetical protein
LLNILEHLPRTSAYVQALATDEDMAEQVAKLSEQDRSTAWLRAHRDYTAEVEMLTAVYDRLGELIRISAAVHGARGKPATPGPRPVYAIERIRKRQSRQKHDQLVTRLVKKKKVAE